ncbi:MAG: choice-of-anchor D domain-containing protein [Luteolibacter sp.]
MKTNSHFRSLAEFIAALLLVFATCSSMQAQVIIASDNALNYDRGWVNGSNGGTGFGNWTLTSESGSGRAGCYTGDPSHAGIVGFPDVSFGLQAGPEDSGASCTASRNFKNPLAVGQSFSFQWGIVYPSDTGSKGFKILAGEVEIVDVSNGNQLKITVNGVNSNIAYGLGVMTWRFTRTSETNLQVTSTARDGSDTPVFTTNVTLSSAPTGFIWYASNLPDGDERQPFFNNLLITASSIPEPAPEITVLDAQDQTQSSGAGMVQFAPTLSQTQGSPATLTIRNDGDDTLTILDVSKSGDHPGDFLLGAVGSSSIAPGNSSDFTVTFAPTAGGTRSAQILISSNDDDESSFIVNFSGFGISTALDSDGDGLNDEAEYRMSALGFDWLTEQPQLVSALMDNASAAGLHTTSQIQEMNIGVPLITKNASSGNFELTVGLQKSTDLQSFQHFPLNETETSIEPDGRLKISFTSDNNAAFFRIKAEP